MLSEIFRFFQENSFIKKSVKQSSHKIKSVKKLWKSFKSVYRSSLPEVFCKKGVPRNFTKFTGKHLCQSLFLKTLQTWGSHFPVNFVKFLRTPIFIEHLWWLLLNDCTKSSSLWRLHWIQYRTGRKHKNHRKTII